MNNMNFVQFADAMSQQFTAFGNALNGAVSQYQQLKAYMDQLQYYAHSMAVPAMPQAWSVSYDVSPPQANSAPLTSMSSMPQAWSAPIAGVMPQAWCPSSVGSSPPGFPFPQR